MLERYRRWFAYEKEAQDKALASLHSVPELRRREPAFQKAVDLFAHMLAARQMWLFRIGASSEKPQSLFPRRVKLEVLAAMQAAVYQRWDAYLGRLDEAELQREFKYQSYEGDWYWNRVEDILTQLFGHAWYHRGQIAALVRSLGGQPAETDYIFWTRAPAENK